MLDTFIASRTTVSLCPNSHQHQCGEREQCTAGQLHIELTVRASPSAPFRTSPSHSTHSPPWSPVSKAPGSTYSSSEEWGFPHQCAPAPPPTFTLPVSNSPPSSLLFMSCWVGALLPIEALVSWQSWHWLRGVRRLLVHAQGLELPLDLLV